MSEPKHSSLYTQVKNKLLEDIRAGVYQTGDKLPIELDLCSMYGVSRTTIRLAMQQLYLEGHIRKIQGRGTFVTKNKITHRTLAPLHSFADHMQELGKRSASKVLETGIIPAEPPFDHLLRIPAQSPITRIDRLRLADDEPVVYELSYIPWHVAPALNNEDCTGSLFKLLKEKYDKPILRSVETIEPIIVEPDIAALLQIKAGSPIFRMKTIAFTKEDAPVEYSIGYIRSDAASFVIDRSYPAEM
jgi:GntR family transcriptional regulator